MIEDLIYECQSLSLNKSWHNNSPHNLYYKDDSVYSLNKINKGQFIGYIVGKKAYTWDTPPNKYCVWLNDYYVIDCRETPRCITSMIRKVNGDEFTNCIMAFSYANDSVDAYIIATHDIYENTELIVRQEYLDDFL